MKVRVDQDLCSGQGRCYTVSPDVFHADDEGFCAESGTTFEVAPGHEAAARLGAESCPEGAIAIVEGS